jgi:hypothetical protein
MTAGFGAAFAAITGTWMPIYAQPPPSTMPPFEEVDLDHDNILSIEEARRVFGNLTLEDLDNDGFLDKREAEKALDGLIYTRDTHEDAQEHIGLMDYMLMAEYYLTPHGPALEPAAEKN